MNKEIQEMRNKHKEKLNELEQQHKQKLKQIEIESEQKYKQFLKDLKKQEERLDQKIEQVKQKYETAAKAQAKQRKQREEEFAQKCKEIEQGQKPMNSKLQTELIVTKINPNNASEIIKLAIQFYCEVGPNIEGKIIITKLPQLTDNEFSVLAGKLVMSGFNVELL